MTNDVVRRFNEHKTGKGCRFTRSFGVKKLLLKEEHPNKRKAMKREIQIKALTKIQKLALIKRTSLWQ